MTVGVTLCFYVVIFVCVSLFADFAQKQNKKCLLLVPVVLLAVVAGLRSNSVGVDTSAYIRILECCFKGNFLYVSREYLFYYSATVLLNIWHSYNFLFFIYAFLIYILIFLRLWDFRNTTSLKIAALCFCLFFWGGTLNGLRQYIAVAMIFYATKFLSKEQYIKFFIWVLIASSFHVSAMASVIYVVLYIGIKKAYPPKQLFMLLFVICAVIPAGVYICLNTYDSYTIDPEGIGIMRWARLLVPVIVYIVSKSSFSITIGDEISQTKDAACNWLFMVVLLGAFMGFGTVLVTGIGRIAYYFRIFECIYFSTLLKPGNMKNDMRLVLLGMLILYGTYQLYVYNGIVPYSVSLR